MSAKTTGFIWDLDLSARERMVLLAMVDHADHDGDHIYAPIPYIAWKTGYSARNTARIIDDLIAAGILSVTKQGLGESNEYRFDFSRAKMKQPYRGRKPKKPLPTPDKMTGAKKRTPDKMTGVRHQNGSTPDVLASPHDNMTWDTHDNLAIDHDKYHIEPDHDPPPPTNPKSPGGGGGVRTEAPTETERLLLGFTPAFSETAAFEFRDLPPDVVRAELRAAKANGTGPGALVRRWRRVRPSTPQPTPRPALPAPPRVEQPPDLVSPQDAARVLGELRKKYEETRHAS